MNKPIIICVLTAIVAFGQAQTPFTVTQSAGSATGEIRMQERRTNGQNYVGLKAPQSVAASTVWTLPAADGTSGQCLQTDGAGQWVWRTCDGKTIADYTWTRTNGTDATGTLTAPGAVTITLTPCPLGIVPSETANYAYISGGTGTAEVVAQTGTGTGAGGDSSCDVEYTTTNAHTGAWTIQSATFREAVNVSAHGETLRVPAGAFAVRAGTKVDKSVTIQGSSRIGVGGGSSITSDCTTCDVIDIDTELPVTLRNFGLVSSVTQASGSGIRIRATAGTHNCSSRIEDLTVYGFYDLIWGEEACKPTIIHNELESPTRYGILLENTYLGDAGDQFVSENTITGNTSGTVGLFIRGGGGTRVLGNKFLGWTTSVEADITYAAGISTSQLIITGNMFDQGVSYGIKLGGTKDWVHTVINGNTFTPSGGSFTCFKFGGSMSYISVTGNTCTNAAIVLDADASSEPIWYWGNSEPGHTTLFTGTASINWFAPETFTQATLPAAEDGSMVFCSNCTASGASGGTGAHAFRQNGAWVFVGGGQAHLQGGNAFGANAVYGTTDNFDLVFKRNSTDQMYIESGVVTGLGAVRSLNTSIDTRIQSNVFSSGGAIYTATNHDLVLGSDKLERWRLKNTGMLVPSLDDAYDIGEFTTPKRVRAVYGKILDTALAGGTGDYMQTRKLQLFDNTGSSTGASYWDLNVVMSGVGAGQNSYFYLRDNGGNTVWRADKIASGSPVATTTIYTDLLPDSTANVRKLGKTTQRWDEINGASLDLTGAANITGNLSAAVINATGSPAYRVSGTTVINASRAATFTDLTINTSSAPAVGDVWTATSTGGAGSWQTPSSAAPFIDSTAIIKGSADATKQLKIEVDGFTTATTRTLTPQNNSYTIAGTNISQTFSNTQTFSGTLSVSGTVGDDFIPNADGSYVNGTTSFRWGSIATYNADFNGVLTFQSGTTFTGSILPTTNNLYAIGNTSFRVSNIATVNMNLSGTITAPNGNTGLSATKTVGDGSGGSCTITISGGIITASTCP